MLEHNGWIMEEWRDVAGYEGLYQVSNHGRVKSISRKSNQGNCIRERILKQHKNNKGYPMVGLHNKGERKCVLVHRIVASAFIPNPRNMPEVNHKDEVKTNNNAENLEWCDRIYNNSYGTGIARRSAKEAKAVLMMKDGAVLREFPSAMEVQRELGFAQQSICACCNKKQRTAYGFNWCYKEMLGILNGQ